MKTNDAVTVTLTDFYVLGNFWQDRLHYKFTSQSKGYLKWLAARDKNLTSQEQFLPIEFIRDAKTFTKGNGSWVIQVDDEEAVLETIKEFPFSFSHASNRLKSDRAFLFRALTQGNPRVVSEIPKEIASDCSFALGMIRADYNLYSVVDYDLLRDDTFLMKALEINPMVIKFISGLAGGFMLSLGDKPYRLGLQALKLDKKMISFVVPELVVDVWNGKYPELGIPQDEAKEAILNHPLPSIVNLVPSQMFDKDFAMKWVEKRKEPETLLRLPKEMIIESEELMLLLFDSQSDLLEIVGLEKVRELKRNKKFILKYLESPKTSHASLYFVSPELRRDLEVVTAAIKKDGSNMYWVPKGIRNRELIEIAINNHVSALEYAPKEWLEDEEFVFNAIKQNTNAFKFASENLRGSKAFILKILHHLDQCQKANEAMDISLPHMMFHQHFQKFSHELQNDKEFLREVLKVYPNMYAAFPKNLQQELALDAVKYVPHMTSYLDPSTLSDEKFIREAIKYQPAVLRSSPFSNDREIVMEALKYFGIALQYVKPEMKDMEMAIVAVKTDGYFDNQSDHETIRKLYRIRMESEYESPHLPFLLKEEFTPRQTGEFRSGFGFGFRSGYGFGF